MQSLEELFRIGDGPSSSHTMGPRKAAKDVQKKFPESKMFKVTLYKSLAETGKGHHTDIAIEKAFKENRIKFDKKTDIKWEPEKETFLDPKTKRKIKLKHENGMVFEAFDRKKQLIGFWEVYSIGGGALSENGKEPLGEKVYDLTTMTEVMKMCQDKGITYWEYVEKNEGEKIWVFLENVWDTMKKAMERGLSAEGVLQGGLHLPRKASVFKRKTDAMLPEISRNGRIWSYAYAVAEENAAATGYVVAAPTCGSCGVLPAVLYYVGEKQGYFEKTQEGGKTNIITRALATAGLIGNFIKTNASIAGATVGCAGEIGTACSMAAGAVSQMFGGSLQQIEYAAEMALEHHLGLTCDCAKGLVQIPCIERNAHAATRAISCAMMATYFSDGTHIIPFDNMVQIMDETGRHLKEMYRETSKGGIGKYYEVIIECKNCIGVSR